MAAKDPVIIKKVKKVAGHGGHHGGAWKIAYADFVTAMMAFFLLMWLLAVADMETKRGLSDYFNNPPVRLTLMGGEGVGAQAKPLPGGGEDLKRQEGEIKSGATKDALKMNPDTAKAEAARKEKERQELQKLKEQITAAIDQIPSLQPFKGQLLLDLTSEGLRIQVIDQENRPMFDQGRSRLKPYAGEILRELSKLINETNKKISISGHTDSTPYVGGEGGYSNWELSNDRANAARRALVAGGLDSDRVMRVVGLASTALLDKENPANPQNRRIAIVVMNKDAADAISDSGDLETAEQAGDPSDAGAEVDAAAEPGEPAGEAEAAEPIPTGGT